MKLVGLIALTFFPALVRHGSDSILALSKFVAKGYEVLSVSDLIALDADPWSESNHGEEALRARVAEMLMRSVDALQ